MFDQKRQKSDFFRQKVTFFGIFLARICLNFKFWKKKTKTKTKQTNKQTKNDNNNNNKTKTKQKQKQKQNKNKNKNKNKTKQKNRPWGSVFNMIFKQFEHLISIFFLACHFFLPKKVIFFCHFLKTNINVSHQLRRILWAILKGDIVKTNKQHF